MPSNEPIERVAFTKAELCARNSISASTLHKLEQLGLAPKYMRVNNVIRCSLDEERAWQQRLANLDPTEAHERAVKRARNAAESDIHVSKRKTRKRAA